VKPLFSLCVAILLCLAEAGPAIGQRSPAVPAIDASSAAAEVRQLSLAEKRWSGDFDRMVERRMIRFLVPYSRTLYYNDRGRERGGRAALAGRAWAHGECPDH